LSPTTRIVFAVGTWKGQARANIRKFISSDKYSGPTKSGLSLGGPILVELLAALRALQASVLSSNQGTHVSVGKTVGWEIRVAIIPADEESELPRVDVREFVEKPTYNGPTKAGVRFPWDKLKQFVQLLEVLVRKLGTAASEESSLFPEIQPDWIQKVKETPTETKQRSSASPLDLSLVKTFPDQFLSGDEIDAQEVPLPPEPLKILRDCNGSYL